VIALLGSLVFAVCMVQPMGGRMRLLAHAQFRYEFLLPTGLLIQLVPPILPASVVQAPLGAVTLLSWLAGSIVLILACALNWGYVGFRLVALGVALNALVITTNRGMPVATAALRYLGVNGTAQQMEALTPLYHLAGDGTTLVLLSDVLPVPGPGLIQSVVSLGDLVLMVGISLVVLDAAKSLLRASRTD